MIQVNVPQLSVTGKRLGYSLVIVSYMTIAVDWDVKHTKQYPPV